MRKFIAILSCAGVCALASAQETTEPVSVVPMGDFQDASDPSASGFWKTAVGNMSEFNASITLEEEEGNKFVRFQSPDNGKSIWLNGQLEILPEWKTLTLRCKMRGSNIAVNGEQSWFSGTVIVRFKDASMGMISQVYEFQPRINGDSDWKEFEASVAVPAGAASIEFQPGLWGTSGTVDFDDFAVIPQ